MFRALCATIMVWCVCFIGCGDGAVGPPEKPQGVAVKGKITLPNGSPLTAGTLVLRPETGLHGAMASIGTDGSFSLQESGTSEIVPGRYQVFVRVNDPALAKAVPAKYLESSEDTDSDVVVEIQGSVDNLVIKLKS
ncbi:MAG: hypothetical protein JNL67_04420 [Planctomycetaceae bacterium]|nr:hypothetical protein [Planctomycetaceae bacterium]